MPVSPYTEPEHAIFRPGPADMAAADEVVPRRFPGPYSGKVRNVSRWLAGRNLAAA
jgi:hypothetical protein